MISQTQLSEWIGFLRCEKANVEQAIAQMEKLRAVKSRRGRPPNVERQLRLQQAWASRPKRRGRKSMGAEERQEVSTRMKKYWAGRRANNKPLSPEEVRLRTGGINPANIN